MTEDNVLSILDIMYRLTVIFITHSNDLEASIYKNLEDCLDDINDLYYSIKEGD